MGVTKNTKLFTRHGQIESRSQTLCTMFLLHMENRVPSGLKLTVIFPCWSYRCPLPYPDTVFCFFFPPLDSSDSEIFPDGSWESKV